MHATQHLGARLAAAAIGAALALSALAGPAGAAAPAARDLLAGQLDGVDRNRVVVKFADGSGVRPQGATLTVDRARLSLPAQAVQRGVAEANALLARLPGAALAHRVDLPPERLDDLRARAEARSGEWLPDMSLYLEIRLPRLGDERAERERLAGLLAELNRLETVQFAFAAPMMEVAGWRTTTPDFSPQQGYLYASPVGVNAETAWGYAGGAGQGVKVCDIEFGWRFTHEDFRDPFFTAGDPGVDDHGTAVLGEISALDNGYGVTGIAHQVEIGGCSVNGMSLAQAVLTLTGVLAPGDIYVIELHAIGPFGKYLPMEYWPDNFDAIRTATALDILGCEAAGNGSENLDFVGYQGVFDRRVRDSGAILCGAGTPQGLTGEWFTNYGSRVDLEGWGSSVVTTGYGDLWNTGPDSMYTAGFNGTSSATPIVTGAVASLQGQARSLFGEPLSPALAQEILSRTGSPWNGTKAIGERPDLVAARPLLEQGYADVDVTVRDAQTLLPLEGIVIEIVETGRLAVSDADGTRRFQMSAGEYTLRGSSFFYTTTELPVTVVAGEDRGVYLDLPLAPTGGLQGVVLDPDQAPLAGARIACLDAPLGPVSSGPDGSYVFDGLPQGPGYRFVVGGVPALSVLYKVHDVIGGEVPVWDPQLVDAQTFESNNGGFTGSGQWQWGTPTGPGPHSGYSGAKCWKTNLSGYYGTYQWMNLDSPAYDFAGADTLLLSFHHWYWIDAYQDGGNVQVWQNGSWHIVEPVGGYDYHFIPVLESGPGYTGSSDGWQDAVFDITAYRSASTRVRFRFASGPTGIGPGWLIDDVAFDTNAGTQSVELAPTPGPGLRLARPAPSPALGDARIGFRLPSDAAVRLSVLDAGGRRVRALREGAMAAGEHAIAWDGRDDAGETVAAGVYYVRLEALGRSETRAIVRLR
jgi:hypothetical protein